MADFLKGLGMNALMDSLGRMKGRQVLVMGDLMLDSFVMGDVDRISPEAPIAVLKISEEKQMLGGAGNVIANLAALGVTPHILSVIGADTAGERVRNIAAQMGADTAGLLADDSRPTTLKSRFVSRGQQLLRTDFEKTHALDSALAARFESIAKAKIATMDAVVLSDYGKGMLTPALTQIVIALAKRANVPVLVDPKGRDFSKYKGADIITPNRKELSEATGGLACKTDDEIVAAALQVRQTCASRRSSPRGRKTG